MTGRALSPQQREQHDHVPLADRDRARFHPFRWLTPGTSAMTLGRHVLIRPDHVDDERLIAHELVHVRQWRELGVARFLFVYVRAYLRGRMRGLGHWKAYEAIPLEVEARELSGR